MLQELGDRVRCGRPGRDVARDRLRLVAGSIECGVLDRAIEEKGQGIANTSTTAVVIPTVTVRICLRTSVGFRWGESDSYAADTVQVPRFSRCLAQLPT